MMLPNLNFIIVFLRCYRTETSRSTTTTNIIQNKMKNYSTTPPAATGLPAKNPFYALYAHSIIHFNSIFGFFFLFYILDNLLLLLYSLIIYYETIYSSQSKGNSPTKHLQQMWNGNILIII